MKYEIRENKFGKFFIKNYKYHYLDSYEVWGLDTSLWYDTIDYKFFKVKFIEEDNKKYIQLSKNKKTRQLEHTFN
jgi:hypothetical protein